ncbi:TnsA endonuclease C-terminal domain-containing protein [Clostridium saccharoperbutylacetonicum]|uniref:TnsA endonuclease C-terminal domain-containing protein n=1 Tax=Clostridium saccharoperbutylacetonicum TaxID=36745 RepID=UPI0039EA1C58
MTKRNLDWTPEKFKRFLKEGRGKGEGKEYKPWLTIQDMPSLGRVSRILGWKSGRIHHLFTDVETRYFYLLEWEDSNYVVDIREQFPLLDIEEVIADKDDINLNKYSTVDNEAPYVLATTFLITLRNSDGKIFNIARSVKSSYELEKKSIIERYEIERRYYESKNIDFGIVTEKDIPITKCKNIQWIHSSYRLDIDNGLDLQQISYLTNILIPMFKGSPLAIRKITSDFDDEMNITAGTGLLLFKHLIAKKVFIVNMNEKIDISKSAKDIVLINEERRNDHYAIGS